MKLQTLKKQANKYAAEIKPILSYNTGKTYIKFALTYIAPKKTLDDVLESIYEMSIKDSSKNTYIAALNHFKKWMLGAETITYDKIKITGTDRQLPAWYDKLEDIMWSLDDPKTPVQLALYILARTGLRWGAAPEPEDRIDFSAIEWTDTNQQAIKVRSKGNKYKWVILPPEFKNYDLKPLASVSKKQALTELKRVFVKVGLEPKVNLHMTRYFFANYNRIIGLNRDEIMKIGGWSSDAVDTYLFDNVEEIAELSTFQYMLADTQIRELDNKGKAQHFKKMYSATYRKLVRANAVIAKLKEALDAKN